MRIVGCSSQALPARVFGENDRTVRGLPGDERYSKSVRPIPSGWTVLRFGAGGEELTLATYNAHEFYRNRSGELLKSPEDVDALAEAILAINADILGLQEVGSQALLEGFNRDKLGKQYRYIYTFEPNVGSRSQVALMAKEHLQVVEVQRHPLRKSGRGLLEVAFRMPSGQELTVLVGHFKSLVGGESETHGKRREECEKTIEIMRAYRRRYPHRLQVLLIDGNMYPNTEKGLELFEILSCPDEAGQEQLRKITGPQDTYRGHNGIPDTSLDSIWADSRLKLQETVVPGLREEPYRTASDHVPVVSRVLVPALTTAQRARRQAAVAFGGKRLDLIA